MPAVIDPATRLLLQFIGSQEGGGDYNICIGERPGRTAHRLVEMDLEDIYLLQSQLTGAQRQPSSAVGLYQFIHPTLLTLQQRGRIPLTTLFTPELQDSLAVQLMIGRGYPRWWRGSLGDDEFMHGLSCEWASLPDPYNDGKSHYDGIGPNHAGHTLNAFAECLSAVAVLIPGRASA